LNRRSTFNIRESGVFFRKPQNKMQRLAFLSPIVSALSGMEGWRRPMLAPVLVALQYAPLACGITNAIDITGKPARPIAAE